MMRHPAPTEWPGVAGPSAGHGPLLVHAATDPVVASPGTVSGPILGTLRRGGSGPPDGPGVRETHLTRPEIVSTVAVMSRSSSSPSTPVLPDPREPAADELLERIDDRALWIAMRHDARGQRGPPNEDV